MTAEITIRPATPADFDLIAHMMSIGFGLNEQSYRASLNDHPLYTAKDMIIAELNGQPVGKATAFSTQMWLSGVPLQMGAVAGVITLPEFRGQGIGTVMMQHLLEKMAQTGMAISVLFPGTVSLYQRCGYADAATWHAYSIKPQNLTVYNEASQTRPFQPDDLAAVRSLYRGSQLSQADGRLTRSNTWWSRLVDPAQLDSNDRIMVYEGDIGLEGYLKYRLLNDQIKVREMFVASDAAYRGLWGHLAAQTTVQSIDYLAAADDPLWHLMTQPQDSQGGNRGWVFNDVYHATVSVMLRIIDVAEALTSRFYPHNMMGNRVLKIHDPQLPQNENLINFRIVDGRPDIIPVDGKAPQIETDIATLSQIFCGFLSPDIARRLGKLEADDDTVAWLSQAMATDPLFIHADDWF